MNSESDNPNLIDDDQLDGLLREVYVPADLKAELLSVADEPSVTKPSHTSSKLQLWHVVLAACLAGVAAFGSWYFWTNDSSGTARMPSGTIAKSDSTENQTPPTAEMLLAEMEALQTQFDHVLATAELEKLEASLAEFDTSRNVSLSRDEVLAITYAVADQTAVQLGSPRESTTEDMQFVIESFPNTRGAKIAREFIEQTTVNESERTKS